MVYTRGARPLRDRHDYTDFYDEPRDNGDRQRVDEYGRTRPRSEHEEEGEYREDYQSPPRRSRSRSPTRDAGKPTDTVILEGLPYEVDANELQESILRNSIAADFPPETVDVRVTASRHNRRAFVQFESVDYAMDFVKEHFPKLHLELSHPADGMPDGRFSAYVHYARDRSEDHRPAGGKNWNCPSCDFSNYVTRNVCKICGVAQPTSTDWQQSLTGLADAANVPSQILVVYPLASFVNEDMLAQDMKRLELEKPQPAKDAKDTSSGGPKLKSTAPTGNPTGYGARPGSLHRVFLMRDAMSNESFKYGFAEFWTLEDAAAAMAKFNAARSFTVAAVAVNVSTIHMGVFLPEAEGMPHDTEYMSFNPLFNPSLRVRYRDPRLYPSQQIVTSEPPGGSKEKSPADEDNDVKKSKKRKAEGNQGAATKKPAVMAGQMAMWQRKADELRGQKGASHDAKNTDHALKTDSDGPIKISLSGAKIGGPSPTEAKRTPSPDKPSTAAAESAPVSYVDRDRLMCLICMRKYKSVDEVNIHEKSRNHKTSTENEDLVKAALPRLAARDKRQRKSTPESHSEAPPDESQYRDRAKERRQAYSQPKKASKPQHQQPSQAPAQAQPSKPKESKGAGMLAKFGWKTGEGLGADGQGRTEVIAQNAYQEGAGLGAEGANLGDAAKMAERKTKGGYAEYVSSVQDRARERYNRME